MNSTSQSLIDVCARAHSVVFPERAIDPVTLNLLVGFVIKILSMCLGLGSEEAREARLRSKMRQGGGFARRHAMRAVKEAHPGMRRRERKILRDQLVEEWALASDEAYDDLFRAAREEAGLIT